MRIYFCSPTIPKKSAKRLHSTLKSDQYVGADFKLSQAQNLTAEMLGYSNWSELKSTILENSVTTSKLDEDCTEETLIERLNFQNTILSKFLEQSNGDTVSLTAQLSVSASCPGGLERIANPSPKIPFGGRHDILDQLKEVDPIVLHHLEALILTAGCYQTGKNLKLPCNLNPDSEITTAAYLIEELIKAAVEHEMGIDTDSLALMKSGERIFANIYFLVEANTIRYHLDRFDQAANKQNIRKLKGDDSTRPEWNLFAKNHICCLELLKSLKPFLDDETRKSIVDLETKAIKFDVSLDSMRSERYA